MRLKYLLLSLVFFSSSFIFSQSSKHNSWITDLDKNVNAPFSEKEKLYIKVALGEDIFKKFKKIKPLEINIKNILRNRVQILNKKFAVNESFPKLSSVSNSNKSSGFNPNHFNPLLYDFDFDSNTGQTYRVDGTDYLINIIPKKLK